MINTENNDYEKAMIILENILKKKYPNNPFTDENKNFLILYSILKKYSSPKDVLTEIGVSVGEQTYYKNYPEVKKVHEQLQAIYKRFKSVCGRDSNAFGGFIGFLEWWHEEMDENGEHYCYYCGVKESISKATFENKKIDSKKFTGGLQIDRKNPDKGYNKSNCVFACVLCNNAKSDMISENDFKKYFGKATEAFWEHISNEK